jgi:hypothetical protein
MQFSASRFRKRFVGGVSDQQVPEPESVLVHKLRPVGTDELPAYERGEFRHDRRPRRCKRLDGTAMEYLAFYSASLEDRALERVELV